jgi:hypothetical protein
VCVSIYIYIYIRDIKIYIYILYIYIYIYISHLERTMRTEFLMTAIRRNEFPLYPNFTFFINRLMRGRLIHIKKIRLV